MNHTPPPCTCPSCERKRASEAAGYVCQACGGTGQVPSIAGPLRPCSRCRWDAFDKWTAARRPNFTAKG